MTSFLRGITHIPHIRAADLATNDARCALRPAAKVRATCCLCHGQLSHVVVFTAIHGATRFNSPVYNAG